MLIREASEKEVLTNVGKNTFRFLRESAGFDFEAPTKIITFNGSFTINNIWNALKPMHDSKDTNVAILLADCTSKYERQRYYKAVKLVGDKDFDIVLKSHTYFSDWRTLPDTFYRKGDFNELRKVSSVNVYVIAQLKKYALPVKDKYQYTVRSLSSEERYKFVSESYAWYADLRDKYLARVELKDTTGQGKKFCYEVPSYYYGKIKLSDLIDNSGFFLLERRQELKRKAAQLRAEREKAAYIESDSTGKPEKARAAADEAKTAVCAAIATARTYEELYKLYNKLYKIAWLYRDVESFESCTISKSYKSIKESENAYNYIMTKANKIKEIT